MNGALYVDPKAAPPSPLHRNYLRLALALLVFSVAVGGLFLWIFKAPAKAHQVKAEKAVGTEWKANQLYPPLKEQAAAVQAEKVEKGDDGKWAAQMRFNQMMMEALNRRQQQKVMAQPAEKPKVPKYAPPLHLHNDVKDTPPVSSVPEYLLGVGSYLPCEVETAINSDVEGYFIANVTQVVWDTETGKHALVPPGSKILGNTQSNKLVFGNERLDTISLKLRLPSGKEVDLKNAPVTDEQGQAGLTGEINRHLMRIYGAVFITGVLKGGTMAMQQALANSGGANQVAVSVAGSGTQATSRLAVPLIDTRPTIRPRAGQLCQVILLESLKLPAVWASSTPVTQVSTKGGK